MTGGCQRNYSFLHCSWALLTLLVGIIAPISSFAQVNRLVPVNDPAYRYIQRLQQRGHLLELHPTALPYTEGAVVAALTKLDRASLGAVESRWVRWLDTAFSADVTDDSLRIGATVEYALDVASHRRLDALRPLDDDVSIYPNGELYLFLERGPFIAHAGYRHDNYFERDPDGLDIVNRAQMRSNTSYLGYNSRLFSAYLGRFGNHWATADQPATLISNNPRTYDLIQLRFGTDKLAVRSLFGELDSITSDGRFTGTAGADSVAASERRYVAAHRFDWRPTRHIAITLMEGALISGPNAGLSLKYLNPLHPFVLAVDNRPKNEENNGLLGAMIWAHWSKLTLHAQFMLDDVDLTNSDEPLAYAFSGSVHLAGLTPMLDLGIAVDAVSARAFNAEQAEGRWLFLKRGLAHQFNDFVRLAFHAELYLDGLLAGLSAAPTFNYLAQGRTVIDQAYPSNVLPGILTGTIERTYRGAINLRYEPNPWIWVEADVGLNRITNRTGRFGLDETAFVGVWGLGFRVPLDRLF